MYWCLKILIEHDVTYGGTDKIKLVKRMFYIKI